MVTTITNNMRMSAAPTASVTETDEPRLQSGDASHAPWHLRPFKLFVRILMRLLFRVKIVGLENVPNKPVIICANHLGWADAFAILAFFPLEPRVYILGEKQVAYISGFRNRVINDLQIMVALDRTKPLHALRTMESVLKRGGSLLIFPEGKLCTREGELQELQQGAAHLSMVSGDPLLPVGLTGTSELWLRRALTARVGQPIDPSQFEGDTRTRMHEMTARLATEMRALLPGDPQRPRFKPLRKWLTNLL